MRSNAFPKKEHLAGKKEFDILFERGKSFSFAPLRVIWLPEGKTQWVRAGFTVPRKNFPKAVVRNRLKRRMREAYRKNKSLPAIPLSVLFIYSARDEFPYDEIEKKMILSLQKLKALAHPGAR